MQRVCEVCGTVFECRPYRLAAGGGRFCSRACQGRAKATTRGAGHPGWQGTTVTCAQCGDMFEIGAKRIKQAREHYFCSRTCMGRWYSEHQRGADNPHWRGRVVDRICERCQQPFQVPSCEVEKGAGRFCSRSCARSQVRGRQLVQCTCEICGTLFEIPPAWHRKGRGRYCSRACAQQGYIARLQQGVSFPIRSSRLEGTVQAELDRRGLVYQTGGHISRYYPDLLFPVQRLIVEIDGDYWHTRPGAQERDQARDAVFYARGWRVLHLWEHEINADVIATVNRIERALLENDPP